jgi:acetolactate synthase-1/2/3 large subunit
MTGGEALARMVQAFDGGPIFGMGGFQLLPFYDAARRLGLTHLLVNDERAGAFMADAYAKVTGRVGLVDATLGPGATNLVTGLVEALNAGTPMVALVGDTHRAHSWKNMTQEARQVDILRPASKELIQIPSPERIPELLRRAFAVATSGRPGPVVVDIPEDVCHAEATFTLADLHGHPRYRGGPAIRCAPSDDSIAEAARLLAAAARPVVLAGGGVHISGAHAELETLVRALNLPVAHTMTGKGAIACVDDLSIGVFGRYDRVANEVIAEADVILVVGCKLGEIATKRYSLPPTTARVIHLDIVAEEFGRTVEPEVVLWGDARAGLAALHAALAHQAPAIHARQATRIQHLSGLTAQWRDSVAERLTSDETPVSMARLVHELNQTLPPEAIVVADGGFAAHWTGLLLDTKRAGRGFLPDRGFASIGYGLPAAIGACLAAPGRPIVSVTGDGGFNMMLGEIETARRLGVNPTIIVVNNAASGYVKALQHLMYGSDSYHASDLVETDYAAVAEAMDCRGIRVDQPDLVRPAVQTALDSDRLTVLDVIVTRDPANMLPGIDSRAVTVAKGDRIA